MESIDIHTLAVRIADRHRLRTNHVNAIGSVSRVLEELLPDVMTELNAVQGDEDVEDNVRRITHVRSKGNTVHNLSDFKPDNTQIISTRIFEETQP